mgnify:CR=1 FL=1|jgi:hypothetical protein
MPSFDEEFSVQLHSIFKDLRREWVAQKEGRTYGKLAEHCGVSRQRCSQWATGTDNRQPPWGAVLLLCQELNYEVIVKPKGARLRKKQTSAAS